MQERLHLSRTVLSVVQSVSLPLQVVVGQVPGWLREVSTGKTGRYEKFGPTTHGQSRFKEGTDFIGNGGSTYTYDVFTPLNNLDGQTITISEIGNDYNVSNNATLPAIYKMEAIDVRVSTNLST